MIDGSIGLLTTEEVRDGMMLSKLVDNASENNHVNGILAYAMYRQQYHCSRGTIIVTPRHTHYIIGCTYRVGFVKYLISHKHVMNETPSTELTNTAYDILKVLGKDADFLYDTIDKYIKDAQNANRQDLVEMWQVIKKDRQKHIHMLKEALEKEIHG